MDTGTNEELPQMDSFGTAINNRYAFPLNLSLTISGSGGQGGADSPIDVEDSASDVGVGNGGSII